MLVSLLWQGVQSMCRPRQAKRVAIILQYYSTAKLKDLQKQYNYWTSSPILFNDKRFRFRSGIYKETPRIESGASIIPWTEMD